MKIHSLPNLENTPLTRPEAPRPMAFLQAPAVRAVALDGVSLSQPVEPEDPLQQAELLPAAPVSPRPQAAPAVPAPGPQVLLMDPGLGGALFGEGSTPCSMAVLESRPPEASSAALDLSPADAQALGAVHQKLAGHPVLARVVEGFIRDKDHPMNLVSYLKDPESRPVVLEHLDRMASLCPVPTDGVPGVVEQTFNPEVTLLTDAGADLSQRDGIPGPMALRQDLLDRDPELYSLGHPDTESGWDRLNSHARHLRSEVLPGLTRELEDLVADMPSAGGFPAVNARAKSASGIADKIDRMQQGNDGKSPRPDYCLADMPDAVGGRITVRDPRQLQQVMDRLEARFGQDGIYEKDNFYASPKKRTRPYRCITYTVIHQGVPCEIQLTTLNASLAADLWHNTGYKPLHPELSESEIRYVGTLQSSVTADEHRILGTGCN